jgi:polyferredoxin
MMRQDLTRFPLVRSLLHHRWPQLILAAVLLAGFIFAILSGLIGTPVGSRNFGIVFTWIAWWAILVLVAVPFFGRGWCAVCPIPLPGEWLQHGALLGPTGSKLPWRLRHWPGQLRNIWLQNASFTLVALFSVVILTTPWITAVLLASMLFAAIGLSMIFERRAFCRYLCPVGGFIGLYAQVAPLELRVKDKQVCMRCADKPFYNGSVAGYGCPWDVFPAGLSRNTSCGLCMECLRTCPFDNIAVSTRPFSADLAKPVARPDEACKAFIMLGAALLYAAVLLGPWGALKLAAYSAGTPAWFGYATIFLFLVFGLLPGLFWLAVRSGQAISHSRLALKTAFSLFATALIPLGLLFWVAFSLSFMLTNAAYILATVSDPFGWGWNLFGTAAFVWQPYLTAALVPLQTLALVGGLAWTLRAAQKIGTQTGITAVPIALFSTAATALMLGLLL